MCFSRRISVSGAPQTRLFYGSSRSRFFNPDIPIETTVRKWLKTAEKTETTNNIAFKNSTCELVAKAVRKNLGNTAEYEEGEKLVCRKYLKLKNLKFNLNFEFTIDRIEGNSFTIIDESTDQAFTLTRDLIQKTSSTATAAPATPSKAPRWTKRSPSSIPTSTS